MHLHIIVWCVAQHLRTLRHERPTSTKQVGSAKTVLYYYFLSKSCCLHPSHPAQTCCLPEVSVRLLRPSARGKIERCIRECSNLVMPLRTEPNAVTCTSSFNVNTSVISTNSISTHHATMAGSLVVRRPRTTLK